MQIPQRLTFYIEQLSEIDQTQRKILGFFSLILFRKPVKLFQLGEYEEFCLGVALMNGSKRTGIRLTSAEYGRK